MSRRELAEWLAGGRLSHLLHKLEQVGVREPHDVLELGEEPDALAEVEVLLVTRPMRNRWRTLVNELRPDGTPARGLDERASSAPMAGDTVEADEASAAAAAAEAAAAEAAAIAVRLDRARYKTQLCQSWVAKGRCVFGADCKFAHGDGELAHAPYCAAPPTPPHAEHTGGCGGGCVGDGPGGGAPPAFACEAPGRLSEPCPLLAHSAELGARASTAARAAPAGACGAAAVAAAAPVSACGNAVCVSPAAPPGQGGGSGSITAPIRVCLNVANIGHFGQASGSALGFSWAQVGAAFAYYEQRVGRQGVCGVISPHTLRRNPQPAHFAYADRMLSAPPRVGVRDTDDIFTIRIAKQHGCQFVDNDCYRGHRDAATSRLDDASIAFLDAASVTLHVHYIFDPNGGFVPDREPSAPSAPKRSPRPSDGRRRARRPTARRRSSGRTARRCCRRSGAHTARAPAHTLASARAWCRTRWSSTRGRGPSARPSSSRCASASSPPLPPCHSAAKCSCTIRRAGLSLTCAL